MQHFGILYQKQLELIYHGQPIGFSGWLSTGDPIAALWQFLLLALGCVVYFPFIKALDKQYLKEELEAEDDVEEDISFDDLDLSDL